MSDTASQSFTPPDPRTYVDPAAWLADWCAGQPDRPTREKLEELARLASCSVSTVQGVIAGTRRLSLSSARDLVANLALPPEHRLHLLELFELQHAPPNRAGHRRKAVLDRVALHSGVPEGSAMSLADESRPDDAASALLSAALLCLEEDRPVDRALLRAAVPALTLGQLKAADSLKAPASRLGPRFVSLYAPDHSSLARLAHQGGLSMALDGLMRLRGAERDFQSYTASVDIGGFLALEEPCRRFEAGVLALALEAQVRRPRVVVLHQVQRFIAAGPLVPGAQGLRWRTGTDAPLAPPQAPALSGPALASPHPTGFTYFPAWVARWRAWATLAGRPCSDAWLAEQTGFKRATVYDICTGTARFLPQHVFAFLCAFGFEGDANAQLALDGMALISAGDGDLERQARLIAALRGFGLEKGVRSPPTEEHFVRSRWFSWVICGLADLHDFQAHTAWLSRALKGRVHPDTIQQALDALYALGTLRRDDDGRVVVGTPTIETEGPHRAVAQYERHRGLLAQQRVELHLGDGDLHPQAWLFALPEQALYRLGQLRAALNAELYSVLQAAQERRKQGHPHDRVVLVSVQSFPLFRLPAPRRRNKSRAPAQESS